MPTTTSTSIFFHHAIRKSHYYFKLSEQTTNAVDFFGEDSLQIMCADLQCDAIYFPSYRVYLSPALGATKENRQKRLFIVTTEKRQKRRGVASSLFGTFSIIRHRHTHAHTRTHSCTPNQSPLIGEIAFKGRVKKKKEKRFTLFIL